MQTTDCKQGTKCSVHSTDMLGTKSLVCDKNSWKQILVTKCEDAGFIFYFGKIKVNKCHATNKKQKGIDTVLGHMIFGTLLYVLYWLFSSLNFTRLLRVVITPSVTLLRGENDSKQSDEFQANFSPVFSCFLFIIIIITYLTRVNPSAEAVIDGCPVFSVVIWNDSLISNLLVVFYPHLQTIVNLA